MTPLRIVAIPGLMLAATLVMAASADEQAADQAAYQVIDNAIPDALTDTPGDPVNGRLIVRDATNATCLICHALPIPEEPDPGNIGPPLDGVADRYTQGELRLRLVDPKKINPETVMPAYYATYGLNRVLAQYAGEPIYSAQEIEDVLAYLMTLHEEPSGR